MNIIVGIGEYAISNNLEDSLQTFALGSCVALVVYSPNKKVLGLVHMALPDSNINPSDCIKRPGHYVDTAIPMLINKITAQSGCSKNKLIFKIYGGAQGMVGGDHFNIGKNNIESVKKALAQIHVYSYEAQVGGNYSRTIKADVATGNVVVTEFPIK